MPFIYDYCESGSLVIALWLTNLWNTYWDSLQDMTDLKATEELLWKHMWYIYLMEGISFKPITF